MVLRAPAKINLGLVVGNKLQNGFHKIYTIYNQVSLYDDIYLDTLSDNIVKITCSNKKLFPQENFAYKAVILLKQNYNIQFGVEIKINKHIPIGSGLGGGSSNAASVLLGLKKLWKINISVNDLLILGKQISADVPYHLLSGTMLESQGDNDLKRFQKLTPLPKMYVVICFPGIVILSTEAYKWIKSGKKDKNKLQKLRNAIVKGDVNAIGQNLYNDFEPVIFSKYPTILSIKKLLLEQNAVGALLSGKGSSVYGLYTNRDLAQSAYASLKKKFTETFLVDTL